MSYLRRGKESAILETVKRRLLQLSRMLLVRVIAIAVLGFAALLVSARVGPWIPPGFGDRIGAGAVDRILSIIANSMLAMAIFSLTMMTAAFRPGRRDIRPRQGPARRRAARALTGAQAAACSTSSGKKAEASLPPQCSWVRFTSSASASVT